MGLSKMELLRRDHQFVLRYTVTCTAVSKITTQMMVRVTRESRVVTDDSDGRVRGERAYEKAVTAP